MQNHCLGGGGGGGIKNLISILFFFDIVEQIYNSFELSLLMSAAWCTAVNQT